LIGVVGYSLGAAMPFELLRNLPKKADDLGGIQASYWDTGVNWSGAITLPPNVGTVLGVYNPSFISTFGLSHARFSRLGAKFLEKMAALRVATIKWIAVSVVFANIQGSALPKESGGGARQLDPQWVRDIIVDCSRKGIAPFHKQWGIYSSNPLVLEGMSIAEAKAIDKYGKGGGLNSGCRSVKVFQRQRHDDN
jgi:hypothetical protein